MSVGSRQCQVWAVHKKRSGRIRDLIRYRHIRHVCVREREFAQEHESDHRCACGMRYAKQASDNDWNGVRRSTWRE